MTVESESNRLVAFTDQLDSKKAQQAIIPKPEVGCNCPIHQAQLIPEVCQCPLHQPVDTKPSTNGSHPAY